MRRSTTALPGFLVSALVLAVFLVAAACGSEGAETPSDEATATPSPTSEVAGATATPETTADSTSGATPTPAPGIDPQQRLHGIAGIIPPNFPTPSEADWLTFLEALPELGEVAGNYTGWSPTDGFADLTRNGELLNAVPGVAVLHGTGFHRDAEDGVALNVDFADSAQVQHFTEDLATFAAEENPLLLGIGNEVNRIWEQDPEAYAAWVAALPDMVDAIHEAAPETQVYVTFQYEFLRGGGAITGVPREPRWELLEQVTPYLDLVAFTTYPYFDYETPEDLPADYYSEGAAHAGIPVAFTEVGWPSGPIAPLEGSALAGLGGTPDEQAAFIERLPGLFEDVDPAFVMWVWAYDSSIVGPTFDSLGLASTDGTHKPAWATWVDLAQH